MLNHCCIWIFSPLIGHGKDQIGSTEYAIEHGNNWTWCHRLFHPLNFKYTPTQILTISIHVISRLKCAVQAVWSLLPAAAILGPVVTTTTSASTATPSAASTPSTTIAAVSSLPTLAIWSAVGAQTRAVASLLQRQFALSWGCNCGQMVTWNITLLICGLF